MFENVDYSIILLLTLFAAFGLFLLWRYFVPKRSAIVSKVEDGKNENEEESAYENIEPLQDFDWSSTEPIRIRPFRPKYHLTMALENCPLSEFLAVDNTYLDRMAIRQQIMDEHPIETYQCNPACWPAVKEMYEWIFGTYLPKRFPTMYKIVSPSQLPEALYEDGPCLYNIPKGQYVPLTPSSAEQALYTLGKNVDDDILILLPSSKAEDGMPIYHLQAYVCCFPSGFSTPEKYGKPLASIHKPVPHYKEKLEKSMDRFFAKLELGKAVRRTNWAITTNTKLYTQAGNHLYADGKTASGDSAQDKNKKTLDADDEDLDENIEQQKKEVDIQNCRLRTERQTLHRLPKTNALVFAFKTYQYKLDNVKAEGNGLALADAIEGLSKGNAPDMAYYKRGVVWGDKVVEYLRS